MCLPVVAKPRSASTSGEYRQAFTGKALRGKSRDAQAASLGTQSRFQKRAAAKCLRAVTKHGAELAGAVAACGALTGLAACLEEFDAGVKEEAAWTLGYVACHSPALAQQALT